MLMVFTAKITALLSTHIVVPPVTNEPALDLLRQFSLWCSGYEYRCYCSTTVTVLTIRHCLL